MDSELKKQLELIQNKIDRVTDKIGNRWNAFLNGLVGGFGYLMGAFIALAIIGFILNVVGIIPAFKTETDKWRELLQQAAGTKVPLQNK